MQKQIFDVVLVSVKNPLIVGLYSHCTLVRSVTIAGRASFVLPLLFACIFKRDLGAFLEVDYETTNSISHFFRDIEESNVGSICYSRGVGNSSLIKLTHIFVQSISIMTGIKVMATNSFYFSPTKKEIKAFGRMSFYQDTEGKVTMRETSPNHLDALCLPCVLDKSKFEEECSPMYVHRCACTQKAL